MDAGFPAVFDAGIGVFLRVDLPELGIAFFPVPHPVFVVIHRILPFLSLPAMPAAYRDSFSFRQGIYTKLFGFGITIKNMNFEEWGSGIGAKAKAGITT